MHGSNGRRRSLGLVIGALAVLAFGAGACGDDSEEAAGGGSTEGVTVKAAEFTWSAAAITTSILEEIVAQNPGLGVDKIERTQLDPAPAWAGAQRGDVDLLTEVAMPNQKPMADKASRDVELLHETYGNANQGWFVPSYAVAPGGEAEGLKSVTQLNDFKDAFDGKLYDADPGWVSTELNAKRLEGYGLDLEHVKSGEAAELAQLKRAYQREEPMVAYLYRPHWVFTQYEMTQLEEPTPYDEKCFDGGDGACAMPAYSAWVAARKDLAEKAPKFHAMLKQFEIPLEEMEGLLAKVDLEKQPAEQVAKEWVDANQDKIATWVGG